MCQQEDKSENMNVCVLNPDIANLRTEDLEPRMVYKVSVVSVLRRADSPEEPSGGIRVEMRKYMYI